MNYTYFFKGVGKKGWKIGVAPVFKYFKGEVDFIGMPSARYQF